MNLIEFQNLELDSEAFFKLSVALRALLIEYNGDWDKAHYLVQNDSSLDAAWVHAYLHRKEGDLGNANYWYTNSEKQFCKNSHEIEWKDITIELLSKS